MNIEILLEVASELVEEPGTNPEYERAVIEVIDRVCEKMDVSGDHAFGIETPGELRRAWIRMQLGWPVDKAFTEFAALSQEDQERRMAGLGVPKEYLDGCKPVHSPLCTCGGFEQEGAFLHADNCTRKRT